MGFRLFFSIARGAASKYAEFKSIELKNQFVTAMNKDPVCVRAYKAYSSAPTSERKKAALEVDVAQYQFYKRWSSSERTSNSL